MVTSRETLGSGTSWASRGQEGPAAGEGRGRPGDGGRWRSRHRRPLLLTSRPASPRSGATRASRGARLCCAGSRFFCDEWLRFAAWEARLTPEIWGKPR